MGSSVSPVVANLCMEAIKELGINTSEIQPKVWRCYVDDSFCIIKKNAVNAFHTTLNSIDPHISCTIEEESDQQIAFLDTLVSHKDNTITLGEYHKANHTDRYLDFFPTMTNAIRLAQLRLLYIVQLNSLAHCKEKILK